MNKKNREQYRSLSFFAAIEKEDKIWVSNLRFNGLYVIDICTGECEFMGRFMGYKDDAVGLHEVVKEYDNKLFFFPHYSSSIDVYDIQRKTFYSCSINAWKGCLTDRNFTCAIDAFRFGDFFYLFPRFPNMPLIKYSISENRIVQEIELKLSNELRHFDEMNLTSNAICVDNKVFFPLFNSNKVIRFDLMAETEECLVVEGIERINGVIAFDGSKFWINADSSIFVFDSNFVQKACFMHCVSEKEMLIINYVFKDGVTYALPAWLGKIKKIDLENNILYEKEIEPSQLKVVEGVLSRWRNLGTVVEHGNYFLANPISLDCAWKIDYSQFTIEGIYYKAPINSLPKRDFSEDKIYHEDGDFDDFLEYLIQQKMTRTLEY